MHDSYYIVTENFKMKKWKTIGQMGITVEAES